MRPRPVAGVARHVPRRRDEVLAELERLPADSPWRHRVERLVPAIAAVITLDGGWTAGARGPHDRQARVGIFGWSARGDKRATRGTSLYDMLEHLRAQAGADEPDPLAVAAWEQCRAAGVGLKRGAVSLDGRRVVAKKVTSTLRSPFGEGALRTWQLVAAAEWVADLERQVLRPGHAGVPLIGSGYREGAGGLNAHLRRGNQRFDFQAAEPPLLGQALAEPEALTTAVTLAAWQPDVALAAVWRGVYRTTSPRETCRALLADLTLAIRAAVRRRQLERRPFYKLADVERAGPEAIGAHAKLAEVIWPTAAVIEAGTSEGLADDIGKRAHKIVKPRQHPELERRLAAAAVAET